ncbi:MAG TPA: acyl carrier protein [Methylomirabilota bacterium]|jgi:acyl carrier protein|nr:acyl carrier protein [Methylomirabilota bacterium]
MNISKADILSRLTDVLVSGFDIRREDIVADARLVDDLELDSLDRVDLVVRLEQETNLAIEEEELKGIQTISDVIAVLHGKLNSRPG